MWQKIKNSYHGLIALFATIYFRYPGSQLVVIGVTGTDGKTTTTHLIHHILITAGKKSSVVSSVYAEIAGKKYDTGFHVTTPDSWMLQKFLRQAVNNGDEFIVLEVTSHGLDQNRVLGVPFKIGVITNITHEHLDYHKTYTSYVKAKEKLLKLASTAIINKDDASYERFDISIKQKAITYGIKSDAQTTPKNFPFTALLPGEYNLYNCLAAISVAKQLGIRDDSIRKALKTFVGVKGRFEKVLTDQGFDIIIDFAHTPNAIEKVLSTVKPQVRGKLIHVFGSAALRDHSKRPIMGKNSSRYANLIILTEEDYRTENVNQIIDDIAKGCIEVKAKEYPVSGYAKALKEELPVFFRIPDRQSAINFAIQKLARKGDTVILTGKAHEKSLCRGTTEYSWSEHKAVEKALVQREHVHTKK